MKKDKQKQATFNLSQHNKGKEKFHLLIFFNKENDVSRFYNYYEEPDMLLFPIWDSITLIIAL